MSNRSRKRSRRQEENEARIRREEESDERIRCDEELEAELEKNFVENGDKTSDADDDGNNISSTEDDNDDDDDSDDKSNSETPVVDTRYLLRLVDVYHAHSMLLSVNAEAQSVLRVKEQINNALVLDKTLCREKKIGPAQQALARALMWRFMGHAFAKINFNVLIKEYPHPEILRPHFADEMVDMYDIVRDEQRGEWTVEDKEIVQTSHAPSVVYQVCTLYNFDPFHSKE
jgi:aromatic ring-cleaving dioxygenase